MLTLNGEKSNSEYNFDILIIKTVSKIVSKIYQNTNSIITVSSYQMIRRDVKKNPVNSDRINERESDLNRKIITSAKAEVKNRF